MHFYIIDFHAFLYFCFISLNASAATVKQFEKFVCRNKMSRKQNNFTLSEICDNTISFLPTDYLPRNADVLKLYFYYTKKQKFTVKSATSQAIRDVRNVWEDLPIPLRRSDHCAKKLINLRDEFRQFQKHDSPKVNEFFEKLRHVFDISSGNANEFISSMNDMDKSLLLLKPIKILKRRVSSGNITIIGNN